jgi:PAS domain S-box-containing protein
MKQDLLQHILNVSLRMAETQDLALLLSDVMDEAIQLVGAERGYVVLLEPDGGLDFRVQRSREGQELGDAEDQISRSILHKVIETSEPLVLRDALQDPQFSETGSEIILELRSIMCVPLISRGNTIGAIYVENHSIRGRFHQDDVIPLSLFANQAAVAIENARLLQSLQQSHHESEMRVKERTLELSESNALLKQESTEREQAENLLRAQRDLGVELAAARGLAETLRRCVETAIRSSGMDCGGVYLIDESGGSVDLAFHVGLSDSFVKDASHYEADSANARMVRAGRPIYIRSEEVHSPLNEALAREGLRALAIIPIPYKGRVIACMNIASHVLCEVPQHARTALETIATLVGSAIVRSSAEEALRESRQDLQTLFDSLRDFLFVLDMEGRILQFNPIVLNRLGYSESELLGESVLKAHPPERHEEAIAIIADVIAGKTDSCPIPLVTKQGALISVETKITRGHWGDQEALFGISRDITTREEAVKTLRENEQFLQGVFDAIQDGISILDRDLTVIRVNQWMERMYGDQPPLVGGKCFEVYQQRSAPCPWCPTVQTLETGEFCREIVPYSLEGEVIGWIELSAFPLKDADGHMRGVIEHVKDISERVQAEEALRTEKAFTEAALDSQRDTFFVFDPATGQALRWNRAFREFTGYSDQEIASMRAPESWYSEQELQHAQAAIDTVFREGQATVELTLLTKHSGAIPFEYIASLVRGTEGEPQLIISVGRDITERKQAEEALRTSEEKFSKAFSSSPIAITLTSLPEGRYVEVNDSFLVSTGFSREEVLGRTARELNLWVHLEDRDRLMREIREEGMVRDLEVRMVAKSGEVGVILMSAEVIELDGEKYLLSASSDITRRKEMEEAVRRRNRELAELNDIIGTLTSTLTLEEVLPRIIAAVPHFVPQASDATIQLLDEAGTLSTWIVYDPEGIYNGLTGFRVGEGIAGWAFEERRTINVPDVTVEPRFCQRRAPPTYRSLLVVPLVFRDEPLGTLSITSAQVEAFGETDEQLLLVLSRYAAIAVQNARLYEQTRRDAETKTMLLSEVNHRVKNNLTGIIGLIHAELRYAEAEHRPIVQVATERLIQRINGLALVHEMLSQSEWAPVYLSDLATRIVSSTLNALALDLQVLVRIPPSPVKVSPRQASNLALIINELVTNTVKHAVPGQEITHIDMRTDLDDDGAILLEYRDDGPGYSKEVINLQREGVGMYLIQNLVGHALRGSLVLANDGGPVTTIRFEDEERGAV